MDGLIKVGIWMHQRGRCFVTRAILANGLLNAFHYILSSFCQLFSNVLIARVQVKLSQPRCQSIWHRNININTVPKLSHMMCVNELHIFKNIKSVSFIHILQVVRRNKNIEKWRVLKIQAATTLLKLTGK